MRLKKTFQIVARLGVVLACISNSNGFADNDSSAYIQWRGDYFGDKIDYLDYINSAAGGTVPQSLANNAFEVGKSFGRLGVVKYGYIVNRGKATRNTQPFKISSTTRAHQIGFSKEIGRASCRERV